MSWRKSGFLLLFTLGLALVWRGSSTAGQLTAAPASPAAAVEGPFLAVVDVNHTIYAVGITNQAPQPRVLVGNGDSAAVGDFDQDGFCEILAISEPTTTTTQAQLVMFTPVVELDGTKSFSRQVVFTDAFPLGSFTVEKRLGDTAVGDFDADGRLDVAFSGRGCIGSGCTPTSDQWVQVLLNKSTGWVRRPVTILNAQTRNYEHIAGMDNLRYGTDVLDDIAAQQYWEGLNNPFHILLGRNNVPMVDSTIITKTIPAATGGISSLVAGDFTGDDLIDVIVGQDDDGDPGQAWLIAANPAGGFLPPVPAYDTNPVVESGSDQNGAGYADAYDFNGDGNLDVITVAEMKVATTEPVGLLLYYGDGTGGFSAPVKYNTESDDWYKVAAPARNQPACLWSQSYFLYLPLTRKDQ